MVRILTTLTIKVVSPSGFRTQINNLVGVERVSAIEIASDALSEYMRRKLRRDIEEHQAQNTLLAVAVSVKVDRSARLFFEARHSTAFFGKGKLRLDDTLQKN